ncbi:MAG TPA: hypothetical protein VMK66_14530 [Myxococcales bacterium]|nr:hypothetical protein [Myxococcales bacterium]
MSVLLCLLLAASRAAIVEGRVGEPGGAGAAFAQVRLAQGERLQAVRTGGDGTFRFRAFGGRGALTVTLPQGWTARGPLSRSVGPAVPGEVIHADFAAVPRRLLRGRLLVAGMPLPAAALRAGAASARTDGKGQFVLEDLPAGTVEIRVSAPPLIAHAELPAGPAEVSRDLSLEVPDFASLRLTPVPQGGEIWLIASLLREKRFSSRSIAQLERLAALVALDPRFRLAMVAPRAETARGAQAAARLQRYLVERGQVSAERLAFATGELAPPRHVTILLARVESQ